MGSDRSFSPSAKNASRLPEVPEIAVRPALGSGLPGTPRPCPEKVGRTFAGLRYDEHHILPFKDGGSDARKCRGSAKILGMRRDSWRAFLVLC
jgi:hypothetical protein